MEPKRLNKYISDAGFCSRREADKLVEQGRVTVNGKIPVAGTKVTAQDKVRVDDQTLKVREEEPVFLLFNKPAGIATTTDLSVRNNIIQALNYPASLLPIGFLDREAEGLMLLSNDTELARKLTKADTKFAKEYIVTVDKLITPDFLAKISEGGIPVPGASRQKNFVAKEGISRFRMVLAPGTNHHVKRTVEALGYKVVHLQRVRLGNLTAGKLPVGMWRTLTEAEIASFISSASGKARQANIPPSSAADDFYQEPRPISTRRVKLKNSSPPSIRSGASSAGKSSRAQNAKYTAKAVPRKPRK